MGLTFYTVLPPVHNGAIFVFYLVTLLLAIHSSVSFIFTYMYYIVKRRVIYVLASIIALLLVFGSFVGFFITGLYWLLVKEVSPAPVPPEPKDWARFYGIMLTEFSIVILLLETVIGPMRSGKTIFTTAWSVTDYSSFLRYFIILLSLSSHH
jgi:hypothetical protein